METMEVSLSRFAALALAAILPVACSGGGSSVPSVPTTQNITPQSVTSRSVTTQSVSSTGNGAPSGPSYVLNIIGVPKGKTASMTNSDRHTIFVNLDGNSDIWLCTAGLTLSDPASGKSITCPSDVTYQVLDGNGTDTTQSSMCAPGGSAPGQSSINYFTCGGALFELPQPGNYSVYGRTFAKPGGSATQDTCATYTYLDTTTNAYQTVVICSSNTLTLKRSAGKSVFQNVSQDLLYLTINTTYLSQYSGLATCLASQGYNTTQAVTVPLFNSCLQNYFWNWDNNGLKHYQLFFFGPN
jgi:hypothetical protein